MSHPGFPGIEESPGPPTLENLRLVLARVMPMLNRLNQGKANVVIDVTLTANAASTVVTDARLSYFGVGIFDPMTANAAAELAAGTLYVTQANRTNGAWTLTHANNSQADRTFRMIVLG